MSRLLAYGVGLSLVALTAAPGFGSVDDDSYPLSTYPMFARPRGKPWLDVAEGVDAADRPVRLAPTLVGHDEVMQVAATVRRAVRAGPAALAPLCEGIAQRAAADSDYRHVVQVRIVGARFDPVRYFVDGPTPEDRFVHLTCAVPRPR